MACTAAQPSIVIDYNREVRVCELRKPIGNLRNYGMDFRRFWSSIERKQEVQVERDRCFCTHKCFTYDSMRHSKRIMLWELPSLYLGHLLGNLLHRTAGAATNPQGVSNGACCRHAVTLDKLNMVYPLITFSSPAFVTWRPY